VRIIPPGIDLSVFKPHDKKLCRKEFGLPLDAFVIVTGSASLGDATKNVPWLFEQLSLLPELGKVIVLLFGEGTVPVPGSLNVRFAGGIRDRGKLARLFAAADVFVTASLMETYGLTIVEAMACGIPVVAFQVGGIPEAAPDGRGAILCGLQDGAGVVRAITTLRKSPELRENLGRLAHNTAHSRNTMSSFGDKFAELYRECVALKQTIPADPSAVLT
jgi:glycosyltransferase involved in cell wall biosynthesis